MGSARYIGRVGALAVALGVGVAVGMPGTALADTEPSSDSASSVSSDSSSESKAPDTQPDSSTDADDEPDGIDDDIDDDIDEDIDEDFEEDVDEDIGDIDEAADDDVDDESGDDADDDATETGDGEPGSVNEGSDEPALAQPESTIVREPEPELTVVREGAESEVSDIQFTTLMAVESEPTIDDNDTTGEEELALTTLALTTPVVAPPNPLTVVSTMVSKVLSWLVGPAASSAATPAGPVAPPTFWAVLAWVRRQFEAFFDNKKPTLLHNPAENSLTVDGEVIGRLVAEDPEHDPLRYRVVEAPSNGTVVVRSDGTFTYTPNGGYTGPDSFVVGVRDEGFHLRRLANLFNPSAVDARTVVEVEVAQPNRPPVRLGDPVVDEPGPTGLVTGSFNLVDPDNDVLEPTENLTPPAFGGLEIIGGPRPTFRYLPTQEARDQAATTPEDDIDTFTVEFTDGEYTVTVEVVVPIAPTQPNRPPVLGEPEVGEPDELTGIVRGRVDAADPDGGPLVFTISDAPAHGEVYVDATGVFVYKPTQAARETAAVTPGEQYDHFRVQVSDGEAMAGSILVEVEIGPKITNVPPQPAQPVIGEPDENGVVTGSLGVDDANLDDLVYTVTSGPERGQVTVEPDGTFTYRPTQAARLLAALSADDAGQSFTVTVSDGEFTQDVEITVAVAPAGFSQSDKIDVGAGPNTAVVTNGKAYVANLGDDTVSVIELATGRVTATLPIDGALRDIVVAGGLLYAYDSANRRFHIIDTVTDTQIDSVALGFDRSPWVLAATPDGGTIYFSYDVGTGPQDTDGVGYLQTDTRIVEFALDYPGTDITHILVSPDGAQLYVAWSRADGLSTPGWHSMAIGEDGELTLARSGALSSRPTAIAASPDGTIYILDGMEMTEVRDGLPYRRDSALTNLAFSPDGSLAYSVRPDNGIEVLDGETFEVLTTITVDGGISDLVRTPLVVSADGTALYALDFTDGAVHVIEFGPEQAADVSTVTVNHNT
ncbi:Ig-like domain-containing protein [Mycolicibacterium phlei]